MSKVLKVVEYSAIIMILSISIYSFTLDKIGGNVILNPTVNTFFKSSDSSITIAEPVEMKGTVLGTNTGRCTSPSGCSSDNESLGLFRLCHDMEAEAGVDSNSLQKAVNNGTGITVKASAIVEPVLITFPKVVLAGRTGASNKAFQPSIQNIESIEKYDIYAKVPSVGEYYINGNGTEEFDPENAKYSAGLGISGAGNPYNINDGYKALYDKEGGEIRGGLFSTGENADDTKVPSKDAESSIDISVKNSEEKSEKVVIDKTNVPEGDFVNSRSINLKRQDTVGAGGFFNPAQAELYSQIPVDKYGCLDIKQEDIDVAMYKKNTNNVSIPVCKSSDTVFTVLGKNIAYSFAKASQCLLDKQACETDVVLTGIYIKSGTSKLNLTTSVLNGSIMAPSDSEYPYTPRLIIKTACKVRVYSGTFSEVKDIPCYHDVSYIYDHYYNSTIFSYPGSVGINKEDIEKEKLARSKMPTYEEYVDAIMYAAGKESVASTGCSF